MTSTGVGLGAVRVQEPDQCDDNQCERDKDEPKLAACHLSEILAFRSGGKRLNLSFMADLGKVLIVAGALAIVAGVAFVLLGRAHVPLGRLPGDIVYRGKNTTFYFPLATSILISVVLSVLLYLVGRFRR